MIIDKDYETILGESCLGAAINNYLKYKKINIESEVLFLLGGGFDLKYDEISHEIKTNETYGNIYRKALRLLGLEYDYNNCKIDEWQFIRNVIDNEKMITLEVKSQFLNYDEIFINGKNSVHCFNIVAYNNEHRTVYLSDGFVPTAVPKCYEGWVQFDDILTGWQQNNNKYYIFLFSDFKITKEIYNRIDKIIYLNLKNNLEKKSNNYTYVDRWRNFVFKSINNNSDKKKLIYNINFQLCFCGFIQSKVSFANYICKKNFNSELKTNLVDCIKKWKIIRLKFYRLAYQYDEDVKIIINKEIMENNYCELQLLKKIQQNMECAIKKND